MYSVFATLRVFGRGILVEALNNIFVEDTRMESVPFLCVTVFLNKLRVVGRHIYYIYSSNKELVDRDRFASNFTRDSVND